jgi:MFS family permease
MGLQMTSFVIIMPLFARRFGDFGAGVETLGLSTLAYALTGTLAAPLMGTLADRLGRRPLVMVSLTAYVFAFTGYLLAGSAEVFIVLRGLAGALTAGLIPAVMGIVADIAPADRRAQDIGIVNGGASAGWIIGPVIGGFLYDRWGYEIPFVLSIAMALVTLGVALLAVPETHTASTRLQPASPARSQARASLFSALRAGLSDFPRPLRTFAILLAVSFVVMFAWAFIEPQFMFYAYEELFWTSGQLGLAISAYGVAMMLGEFFLGRLSDRLGRKPVLVLGLALFSAQFAGLVLTRNYAWLAAGFIVAGLGNALYDPPLNALFLDLAPQAHKGRVMGMKSTAGSLGSMIGPALVVLLAPRLLPQGIFLISLLIVLLVTLLSFLALQRQGERGAQVVPVPPSN